MGRHVPPRVLGAFMTAYYYIPAGPCGRAHACASAGLCAWVPANAMHTHAIFASMCVRVCVCMSEHVWVRAKLQACAECVLDGMCMPGSWARV